VAATVLAVLACLAAASVASPAGPADDRRPNVLLVITDDQPWDTLPTPSGPAAMPFLQGRLADPGDRWIRFSNAFVEVPLCCPSRASILTGASAGRTGVRDNGDGAAFDDTATLATWLHDAGYRTGFVGKYLNGFPWGPPFVPPGWDRFLAKRNLDVSTTYAGYPFVDQGVPMRAGTGPSAYATSFLAERAATFLRGAPADRPWFLVYAPSAPHEPWTPAPADAGSFADAAAPPPAPADAGAPGWISAQPPIDAERAATLERDRRAMLETLAAVDRAVRSLLATVEERGELDETLVIVLSDNGFSFGAHGWVGKRCSYAECVRTPLAIRSPWGGAGVVDVPVSNLDLAPTIADLVGIGGGAMTPDGRSLRPFLDARVAATFERDAVLTWWAGDAEVPAWRGVRTADLSYVEHADGAVELFDVAGVFGPPDPRELRNLAADPRAAAAASRLSRMLAAMVAAAPGPAGP
jgi:arylsulfatase A-like enzyme